MMINHIFNQTLKTLQAWPNPFAATNQAFINSMGNVLRFQADTMKSYMDVGFNQWRAAAEVTDWQSLQDFCKCQTQIAQTMQYKMLNDMRILSYIRDRFSAEMEVLQRNAWQDLMPKAM